MGDCLDLLHVCVKIEWMRKWPWLQCLRSLSYTQGGYGKPPR